MSNDICSNDLMIRLHVKLLTDLWEILCQKSLIIKNRKNRKKCHLFCETVAHSLITQTNASISSSFVFLSNIFLWKYIFRIFFVNFVLKNLNAHTKIIWYLPMMPPTGQKW